jgi:hypothetical protein
LGVTYEVDVFKTFPNGLRTDDSVLCFYTHIVMAVNL